MSKFTHLNVASNYSGHYGVTSPQDLAVAAKSLGFDALAITDRDGLYGAIKHIDACLQLGLDPIVGVNLMVTDEVGAELGRCIILAHGQNRGAGWRALCKLISVAHTKKEPSITRSELSRHLIQNGSALGTVLVGSESDVSRAALAGDKNLAVQLLQRWLQYFTQPDSIAIEIVSHLTQPGTSRSSVHAGRLLDLAVSNSVNSVLTNAVRYVEPDDALTADVLDAARFLEPLGFFQTQPNAQGWLKPANLLASVAAEITGSGESAKQLIARTEALTNLCRLNAVSDCDWGNPKTPEKAALGIEGNPFEILWQQTNSAIERYYPTARGSELQKIQHRLSQELITINKLGFATYFLTVADVAQMIRDMRIRSQARGSGAGSLVNYLLGISGVDPIEHDLLFERFLSVERSTLPDIDIDVESARRHDIYHAIFKRYGSERVTLLSMQSTYRARGAVRDSGLALGLEADQIDEIAKSVWRISAGSFRNAIGQKPELAQVAHALHEDRTMNLLVDITERLNRLPRHISVHPCGVILGNTRLLGLTPVEPSGIGLPMSQFDKDDMDPMGMLKLDVLGVRMQSAMAHAVQEIARVHGKTLDLNGIARDDPKTFSDIRTTNTLGIFQIESPGQRELTGKHQPTRFNDLTIQISLFRPGPMKGNMIAPYLDGRHGFAKPTYLHPDLEPILRETWGVVIFHEQVMRILNVMTGCGLAKADEYRRQMEVPQKKLAIEKLFREQSLERGYPKQVIDQVWQVIEGFSSFGFCKAHGAAFAVPTYQSAWLKSHYPTEFMAGLFTHDPGMYPKRLLLAEARRLGVKVLPICVNNSSREYLVEKVSRKTIDPNEPDIGVRMALTEIFGASESELDRIVAGKPYIDIPDLVERAKPSKRTLENLALIGALDVFGNRSDVIARVREVNAAKRKVNKGLQTMLDFSVLDYLPKSSNEITKVEVIKHELQIARLDISGHALEKFKPMLDEMGVTASSELVGLRNKTEVLVAGVRVATQTPPMRSGKRVVFITLDDGQGCSDVTFFEDAQNASSGILFNTRMILVVGKTRRTGVRGVSVMAEKAFDLNQLWQQWQKTKTA